VTCKAYMLDLLTSRAHRARSAVYYHQTGNEKRTTFRKSTCMPVDSSRIQPRTSALHTRARCIEQVLEQLRIRVAVVIVIIFYCGFESLLKFFHPRLGRETVLLAPLRSAALHGFHLPRVSNFKLR